MSLIFAMISVNRREKVGKTETMIHFLSFIQSQWILFNSRRKWAILYSSATIAGLLCVPGGLFSMMREADAFEIIYSVVPLPLISLLVSIGMYVFNDLIDIDLDRANGKNRPIASGIVTKRQAWFFIISTNSAAVLLSILVFDPIRIIVIISMLVIGIMYSIPKVALMDKFLLKTLSIATFYILCALLGVISKYGMTYASSNMVMPIHAMIMLGIIAFLSSTLNDLGDVEGDKAAGRRTLPVVLGSENTIKLLIGLAASMLATSWMLVEISIGAGLIGSISESAFAIYVISILGKIRKVPANIDNDPIRKQHKKLFPLHLVLQLIVGMNGVAFAFLLMA